MEHFVENFPIYFMSLIIFVILFFVANYFVMNADNKKPLIRKKVKVTEVLVRGGSVEWYLLECENGERLKLRNLDVAKLIVKVGDVGIIEYRGETIQKFEREV